MFLHKPSRGKKFHSSLCQRVTTPTHQHDPHPAPRRSGDRPQSPVFLHATLPGPGPAPPWLRGLCSSTTRLSTCTHREGISYMTQMRTQTRGETLCDLVCGWLMDKTDVCRCVWRGAGRPRALRCPSEHPLRSACLRQRPWAGPRAGGPTILVQM